MIKGNLVYLSSVPLSWDKETTRFFTAVKEFDEYLASDALFACPVEKLVQGPVGDALTHVGQIVMLRRMSGSPIRPASYFTAEIIPGKIDHDTFEQL